MNWLKVRRAILRSPLDRIGYGGYLKLAAEWDGFIDAIQFVVNEFRLIHENMQGVSAYTAPFKVAVLSCWGPLRGWMSTRYIIPSGTEKFIPIPAYWSV